MNDAEWYYGEDGQQRGPVTLDALRERVASGALRPDELVWRAGMAEWSPASGVPELAPAIAATSSAPPPPPPPPGPPPFASPPPPMTAYASYPYDPAIARLRSRANTSLVLGICSIVFSPCCAPVGLGLGIGAVITGRGARNAPNSGSATAGLVCGIIGLLLNGAALIFSVLAMIGSIASSSSTLTTTTTPVVAPAAPTMPAVPATVP